MFDYGKAIQKARKQKGWTQEQLADAIHVKRAVISKYENGQVEPSVFRFKEIAKALEIDDWSQLATGRAIVDHLKDELRERSEDRKTSKTELDETLVQALTGIDSEDVQRVLDFVAGLKAHKHVKEMD